MVNITPAVSPLRCCLLLERPDAGPSPALRRLKRWRGRAMRILMGCLIFALVGQVWASPNRAEVRYSIPSLFHPVVMTGDALPALVGTPASRIAIYAFRDGKFKLIPHQFDRRDADGSFQFIEAGDETKEASYELDVNDELVFMAADAGEKTVGLPNDPGAESATGIEVMDTATASSRWVYAVITSQPRSTREAVQYVSYDTAGDVVSSDIYRASFFKEQPFLISTLSLKDPDHDQWSANLVDTMKVRHTGKLFNRFDFVRTQADYRSRLVAVKQGPVRVIRRTANRVRVFGWLRTPTILMDYLCYRQGITMELQIDVPFRLGWFFSNLVTHMTMDWRDAPDFPETRIYSRSVTNGLTIDGKTSEAKTRFNRTGDTEFLLANRYGMMLVRLDYGPDLPVEKNVYLSDDRQQPDPPETVPGQFGNIGFVTTGWERMDTAPHRMALSVVVIPHLTVQEGQKIVTMSHLGPTTPVQ